jgi:anaerobic magnesium-protoporphyrin IX monomethyl ester cyclase
MPVKVLFIASEDEENLSVRYPAAVLVKAGHTVEIAPFSVPEDTERVLKHIHKFRPDLIAVSIAFQSRAPAFFDLIRKIRKGNAACHITAGGHFPTFEYRKILELKIGLNSIVRFEGEQALLELAEFLEGKRKISDVSNLVFWIGKMIVENHIIDHFPDLDDLPFPVRNVQPQVRLGENFATLVASRGCWHAACAYCCIGAFHAKKKGPRYALRSVGNIAQEIAWLYHKQGVRLFQFHDDNFLLAKERDNIERLDSLVAALDKEKVDVTQTAFLIKARPDSITKNVASRLWKLGVVGVFLGVENATDSGLFALIRGSDAGDIDRAFGILQQHNIIVTYNLLIFHPDATLDEINDNILFMKNHPGYPFDFGRAEIVAGSPLEHRVIRDGLIRGNWPNQDYQIRDPAVDQMFRINLATFRHKDSGYSQLAHNLIALAYRTYVVRRLYPGPAAKDLHDETTALITKSNAFVLDHILKMYSLTARLVSKKDLDDLAGSIRSGSRDLIKEAEVLTGRLDRLQQAEKKFRKTGVPGEVQFSSLLRKIFRV